MASDPRTADASKRAVYGRVPCASCSGRPAGIYELATGADHLTLPRPRWSRHRSKFATAVCGTVIVLLAALCGTQTLAQDRPSDASAELAKVRKHLQAIAAEIAKDRRKRDREAEKLRAVEAEIAQVRRTLSSTEAEIERLGKHSRQLDVQRAELAEQVRSGSAELAASARMAYVVGRRNPLELLLNQQDPARMTRVFGYQQYIARAGARRLGELRARSERLAGIEQEILDGAAEKRRLGEEQGSLLAELETKSGKRREMLASLDGRIASNTQRGQRLEADAKRLTGLVERLATEVAKARAKAAKEKTARTGSSFKSRRGKLPWPTRGTIASRYGSKRNADGLKWSGVVITAREGRRINAIHDGQVVFADWLRGFGLLLIVDHGQGYMSLYGHAAGLLKQPGDSVAAGDPVATVGTSGGRSKPGLYFEIRHQGKPQDPARWCRGKAPA